MFSARSDVTTTNRYGSISRHASSCGSRDASSHCTQRADSSFHSGVRRRYRLSKALLRRIAPFGTRFGAFSISGTLRSFRPELGGALFNEPAFLFEQNFRVGLLDHSDAGSAILGDDGWRDIFFDRLGDVGVPQRIETTLWVQICLRNGLLHRPDLIRRFPSRSVGLYKNEPIARPSGRDASKHLHGARLKNDGS